MNGINKHEETLRDIRRIADDMGDLSRELKGSAEVRTVTRNIVREESHHAYRLPYTSRPDFIGNRWSA